MESPCTLRSNPDHVGVSEVRAMTNWGTSKIYRAGLIGEIRTLIKPGQPVLFNVEDVRRLMGDRQTA